MADSTARLPNVGSAPSRHADCCLSFSSVLFNRFHEELSRGTRNNETGTVLSIGSGSGLLETLLQNHLRSLSPNYQVEGVDVRQPDSQPAVNKYLPEQNYHTVQTTSTVSTRVRDEDVRIIMFVYPRQPSLVRQYIRERQDGNATFDAAIWLGPQADWADFSVCFESLPDPEQPDILSVTSGSQAGLEEYETMAVVRFGIRPGVKDFVGYDSFS